MILTNRSLTARAPLLPILVLGAFTMLGACANLSGDPGRRTPGVVLDDTVLEGIVEREIRKSDPDYKGSHIVIQAYNGIVIIAGQVGTQALLENASRVAVMPNISVSMRALFNGCLTRLKLVTHTEESALIPESTLDIAAAKMAVITRPETPLGRWAKM